VSSLTNVLANTDTSDALDSSCNLIIMYYNVFFQVEGTSILVGRCSRQRKKRRGKAKDCTDDDLLDFFVASAIRERDKPGKYFDER
jgi:hypothetical protein